MRNNLVAFGAALFGQAAMAQAVLDEQDAMLYLESLAIPKKAAVCAKRVEEFSVKFDPSFVKWRRANEKQIQRGEQFLRSAAAAENRDFKSNVEAVTDEAAKLLSSATQSIVKENCEALLGIVGAI
ncbi:MAG: hypothetical protein RBS46_14475 [Methyloversatilis sp.]|jgi:hypothetical protein|nr:hypothetical protein [Methyloversatilis sp.]